VTKNNNGNAETATSEKISSIRWWWMNTDELIEAIRIPGSYVLDSLPGGKYILTPIEPGEIKY
jgi:hypothetical protein